MLIRMLSRIGPKKPARLYLVEWREKCLLTQQQLADRLQTSDVTISRWENDRRHPDEQAKANLAWVFGCEVEDLYRHPDRPSADALLRGESPEVVEQALKLIAAIKRS